MAESIGCASCVRGHHVYQEVWIAVEGETLIWSREIQNREDPFAVAVLKNGKVVGHVLRSLSCMYSCSENGLSHYWKKAALEWFTNRSIGSAILSSFCNYSHFLSHFLLYCQDGFCWYCCWAITANRFEKCCTVFDMTLWKYDRR